MRKVDKRRIKKSVIFRYFLWGLFYAKTLNFYFVNLEMLPFSCKFDELVGPLGAFYKKLHKPKVKYLKISWGVNNVVWSAHWCCPNLFKLDTGVMCL